MRCVFTVATGADKYFRMAIELARSFRLHNKNNEIEFSIFTDRNQLLPPDLRSVEIRSLPTKLSKPGLDFKINFDRIAPQAKCLFLDCDSFVLNDLSPVFERFEGCSVGVVGVNVSEGEWCGADVKSVLRMTGLSQITRFNGGLYYVNMLDPKTNLIFDAARRWTSRYAQLGFSPLGANLNDEPLNALAMAEHSIPSIPDDGTIFADFNVARGSRIDVLIEGATLINHPMGHPGRKWWYVNEIVRPPILHYGSGGYGRYIYVRESMKLYLVHALGLPAACVYRFVDPFARGSYRIWRGSDGTTL